MQIRILSSIPPWLCCCHRSLLRFVRTDGVDVSRNQYRFRKNTGARDLSSPKKLAQPLAQPGCAEIAGNTHGLETFATMLFRQSPYGIEPAPSEGEAHFSVIVLHEERLLHVGHPFRIIALRRNRRRRFRGRLQYPEGRLGSPLFGVLLLLRGLVCSIPGLATNRGTLTESMNPRS